MKHPNKQRAIDYQSYKIREEVKEMKTTYELSLEDNGTVEKLNYSNTHLMAQFLWDTDPELAEALLEELLAQRTFDAMVTNPKGYLNSKEGE